MTAHRHGDRVRLKGKTGTVDKHVAAQGKFQEICVVDWDDGSRSTVVAKDLEREEEKK